MTVKNFEKKYVELQEKSKELLTQLTPLFKELKKVSKKALSLEEKADNETRLYKKPDSSGYTATDGWSIEVLFRLGAFDCIEEAATNIDAVLQNIGKTPFGRNVN